MVKEILFTLLLSAATVTSESNQTNNGTNVSEKTTYYCIVDGEGPGIFIADPIDLKDSKHAGNASPSKYLDNTTETLYVNENLSINTTWKIFDSVEKTSPLHLPVFDHRWEQFVNNHDVINNNFYRENPFNYHISIKIYNGTALNNIAKLEQKWSLLRKDKVGLYLCNKADNCSIQMPRNISEFYEMYATQFWVIHKYTYLHSAKTHDKEIIIYSTGITENCEIIKKGCIFVFLAMCTSCSITLDIHSTQGRISNNFIGTGEWKTQKISLRNITNCFNISATTQITGNPSSPFWAVSDVAHFSKKLTCDDNKRYKQLKDVNTTGLTCENVLNENFNFTTTLTVPFKTSEHNSSLFNSPSLIYIQIPLVTLIVILLYCIYRKEQERRRTKQNEKKLDSEIQVEDDEDFLISF